ncbi:hypothetical protein M885DRAFT_574860 [Pelagophyceae sp. CCMP2097]|nr:hypothetical protein M885DRAFT_574860 [Pelagophyceae sp. CCMP2097]
MFSHRRALHLALLATALAQSPGDCFADFFAVSIAVAGADGSVGGGDCFADSFAVGGWCYSQLDVYAGNAASANECWPLCLAIQFEHDFKLVSADWEEEEACYCQDACQCIFPHWQPLTTTLLLKEGAELPRSVHILVHPRLIPFADLPDAEAVVEILGATTSTTMDDAVDSAVSELGLDAEIFAEVSNTEIGEALILLEEVPLVPSPTPAPVAEPSYVSYDVKGWCYSELNGYAGDADSAAGCWTLCLSFQEQKEFKLVSIDWEGEKQ